MTFANAHQLSAEHVYTGHLVMAMYADWECRIEDRKSHRPGPIENLLYDERGHVAACVDTAMTTYGPPPRPLTVSGGNPYCDCPECGGDSL